MQPMNNLHHNKQHVVASGKLYLECYDKKKERKHTGPTKSQSKVHQSDGKLVHSLGSQSSWVALRSHV